MDEYIIVSLLLSISNAPSAPMGTLMMFFFCHKCLQSLTIFQETGTLEIIFPRSGVLVLKRSSIYADFALRGFSLPPKIRGERGLLVF